MNPLRVRFTLRGMMVSVAIAAVVVGGLAALKSRRDRFHRLAADYSSRFQAPYESTEQKNWRVAMAAKYTRAAAYPWLPVAPDPAKPN